MFVSCLESLCWSGFIDDNFEGVIQCDGYAAYKTYEKSNAGVSLAHCWAHARRKFKEALDEETDKAAWMISKLQRLYRVEKRAREDIRQEYQKTNRDNVSYVLPSGIRHLWSDM